jgi:hypothetical protein
MDGGPGVPNPFGPPLPLWPFEGPLTGAHTRAHQVFGRFRRSDAALGKPVTQNGFPRVFMFFGRDWPQSVI